MVVLGVLLIPVNLGLLPFAPSSQLGLLLVIFSMQMMLLGETPVGTFSRSHLVWVDGLLGAMGVMYTVLFRMFCWRLQRFWLRLSRSAAVFSGLAESR